VATAQVDIYISTPGKAVAYKGKLISEWVFDNLIFPKKTAQKFDEFLP
jgi:hypothetical protein